MSFLIMRLRPQINFLKADNENKAGCEWLIDNKKLEHSVLNKNKIET